jgi:hypothetical protein
MYIHTRLKLVKHGKRTQTQKLMGVMREKQGIMMGADDG